ncbi:hypothetical protein PFICI_12805 [Pestalotiopsis fici W106-1]|uniref:Mitochondrial intermembrane space import and assembly protein 40 n=1 Tax=Pestalotiopsis fici (strain W106-1 / CGMCC3.15140) TaxID=1229662 RepID=W3WSR1_PESFW|nr:uncharacterized protein PFICI_12805 [Pestalotiopsis fici W106-1]ETS75861.1 hypothetical protein PFICI_12805 [Pestalotiopsis fici W106-1]
MYRSALRTAPRASGAVRQNALRTTVPRRFASTAPADKKRSWKSSAVRWGLAAGAVYWYSTSPVFAEEIQPLHVQPPPQFSDDDLPTVEAVIAEKRKEAEARAARAAEEAAKEKTAAPLADADKQVSASEPESGEVSGPEALEAEANQQGAFNPETGEINWDCPCLGGMAHGPCGEEFKAAFSCFVYSKEEPKGMDCIDKFQHMQDCFRLHPEVYGDELADDEEETPGAEATPEAASAATTTPAPELDATSSPSSTAVVNVKTDVKPPTSDEKPSANKPESNGPASKSS